MPAPPCPASFFGSFSTRLNFPGVARLETLAVGATNGYKHGRFARTEIGLCARTRVPMQLPALAGYPAARLIRTWCVEERRIAQGVAMERDL